MKASYSVYELLNTAAGVDSGNLEISHLDAACIAYLEARGMVCLKRHTEVPTEEGRYVIYNSNDGNIISLEEFAPIKMPDGTFIHPDLSLGTVLGPLPEGK